MNWLDLKNSLLPQFFPAEWVKDPGNLYHREFASCICLGYVSKSKGRSSYLMTHHVDRLGISGDELHDVALSNLQDLPSAKTTIAAVPDGAEGYIAAEDNFAAVRILLPVVRQRFAAALGDTFYTTIPHRDDCFCWAVTQSTERHLRHRDEALSDFLESPNSLSPDILLVTATGITVYESREVTVPPRRPDMTLLDFTQTK